MAQTTSAYELHRPHLLWAEIEGDIWWRAVCNTVRTVLAAARVDPSAIAGIGVDGVGWTLIAVDRAGVPLHPAMIWLDRRAEDETLWLKSLPAADHLVNLNANRLDAAYITPKLLWLKRHQPDVFNSAHKFLEATGFIISCFTGEFGCDYSQAYGYHFFDIRNQKWDSATAAEIGIPIEKMPQLWESSKVVGVVTQKAAHQTGLK